MATNMKRIAAITFLGSLVVGGLIYANLLREDETRRGAVVTSVGNSLLPMDDKIVWTITLPREADPEKILTMQIWRVSAPLDDLSRVYQPIPSEDDAEMIAYSNSTWVKDAYPEGQMAIQLINLRDLGIDSPTESAWRVAGGYRISPGIGQIQYRKDFFVGDKIGSGGGDAFWADNVLRPFHFITTTEDTRYRYDVVLALRPPDIKP